jgi:parallel beta-helix repeat protein
MKEISRRSLGILTLAILALALLGTYLAMKVPPPQVVVSSTPAARGPILIEDDADFTRVGAGKGCECARAGSGTERDPYVISNWVINASGSAGIRIFGTNSYFTIERVQVQGDNLSIAINLDQVENGRIEESFISDNFIAAYVLQSSNLQFINNTIENNTYGIQLEVSSNNRVSSNHFNQISEVAIFVRGPDNSVTGNTVRGAFGAINIDGTGGGANDNLVEQNSVSNTTTYGIGVWRAVRTIVRGNLVTRNQGVGVTLADGSSNNTVEENQVTENKGGGIVLAEQTSYNSIRGNTAKGNGDGVSFFDLADAGSSNTWENNSYDTKMPETLD